MKRLVAGFIAAILLGSCVSFFDDGTDIGKKDMGLFYQASGVRPAAVVMTINGEKIRAEEYMYWMAYDCEYLSAYAGSLDWNEIVTGDMTYGDYVKDEVTNTMKTYAIIRQMAKEGNITLTEEDMAALAAQRQQYIDYYGGEEAYSQQIQLLGVSEAAFDEINSMYYLYTRVQEAFCNGALRPDDDTIRDFAAEQELMTAKLLFLSTDGLSEDDIAQRRSLAQGYADKLKAADNIDELYAQFAGELGLEVSENGQTFVVSEADPALTAAVSALQEGEVSGLIEGENGFYVALRMPTDLANAADRLFSQTLESSMANAEVQYHNAYKKIDVSSFFPQLLQARQELSASFTPENTTPSGD